MAQNVVLVLSLVKDSLPWLVSSRHTCPDCACHCNLACGTHTCSGTVEGAQESSFSVLSFIAGCVFAIVSIVVWGKLKSRLQQGTLSSSSRVFADTVLGDNSTEVVVRAATPSLKRRWHHRVLLHRISGPKWLCLTPDFGIDLHNLEEYDHQILRHAVDKHSIKAYKREARTRAAILGAGDPTEAVGHKWMVMHPADDKFGEVVGPDIVEDDEAFASLGDFGLASIEGEVYPCVLVAEGTIEEAKTRMREKYCDVRLLDTDKAPSRHDLVSLLPFYKEPPMPSWGFIGPRVCKELLQNIADGPQNLVSYHAEWSRLSGVLANSAQCHEHRHLCETLRLAVVVDVVDPIAFASFEHTARRLAQLEAAVERNPHRPDFAGLDVLTDGAVSASGAARVPKFASWMASKQKERAEVFKQRRLLADEMSSYQKSSSSDGRGGGGNANTSGGGRGRGKGANDKKKKPSDEGE
eukprot:1400923-Amphidinium_carterae.1